MSDRLTFAQFKNTENLPGTDRVRKRTPLLEAQQRVEQLAPEVFDTTEAREVFTRNSSTAIEFENEYGIELREAFPLLKAENRRQNLKRFSDFFDRTLRIELQDEDPLDFIIDLALGLAGPSNLRTVTQSFDFLFTAYRGEIELYIAQLPEGLKQLIVTLTELISVNTYLYRSDLISSYRSLKYALENNLDSTQDYKQFNAEVSSEGDFYDLFFEAAFKDRNVRRDWKIEYYNVINQLSDDLKRDIDNNNVETAQYTDPVGNVFNVPILDTVVIGGGPLASYAGQIISPLENVTLISNRRNPNPWNTRPIFPNSDSKDGNLNTYRGPLLDNTSNPIGAFKDAGSLTAGQAQDFEDSLEVNCADGKTRFYGSGPDTLGDASDVGSGESYDKFLLELNYIPDESVAEVTAVLRDGSVRDFTLGVFQDTQTDQRRFFLIKKLYIAGGPGEESKFPIDSELKKDADGDLVINQETGDLINLAEYEKQNLTTSIESARNALQQGVLTIEQARIYEPKILSYFDIEKMIEFWVYDLNFSETNFPLEYLFNPNNDIIIAGGGDTGLVIAELIRKLCPKGYLPERIRNLLEGYPKVLIAGAKFSKETDIRRRYRRLLQSDANKLAERLSGYKGFSFTKSPDVASAFQSILDEYVDPFEEYNSGKILVSFNGETKKCIDYTAIPPRKGLGISIKNIDDEIFEAVGIRSVETIDEDLEEKSGDKALSVPGVRIVLTGRQGEECILEVFPEVKVYTDSRKAVFIEEVTPIQRRGRQKNKSKRLCVALQDGINIVSVEADVLITGTGISPLDVDSIQGGRRRILTDYRLRPNRKAIGEYIKVLGSLNGFGLNTFYPSLREVIELLAKENTAALWVWGTLMELGLWDELCSDVEFDKDKIDRLFEGLEQTSLINPFDKVGVRDVLQKIFGDGYFGSQVIPLPSENEGFDTLDDQTGPFNGGENLNDTREQ